MEVCVYLYVALGLNPGKYIYMSSAHLPIIAHEVVFAWNGVVAAPLIEQLLETRDRADVLGVLLSETALSMHLTFDRNRRHLLGTSGGAALCKVSVACRPGGRENEIEVRAASIVLPSMRLTFDLNQPHLMDTSGGQLCEDQVGACFDRLWADFDRIRPLQDMF